MSRFSAIPQPPLEQSSQWQYQMLATIKENLELLTGQRGEKDGASRAVLKSSITVSPVQFSFQPNAQGSGVSVDNATVPTLDDYGRLISDVRALAATVDQMNKVLSALITQMKG